MKKFTDNNNEIKINTKVETLEEKISKLLDESIQFFIENEPTMNENLQLQNKEEIVKKIADFYNKQIEVGNNILEENYRREFFHGFSQEKVFERYSTLRKILNS